MKVTKFDEGNNVINLSGISSTIYLNKDFIGEVVPTETGMQQMPFWLVVGHELSHRIDYLERGNDASKNWIETENVKIKDTEIQATHYENLMREEAVSGNFASAEIGSFSFGRNRQD